jgi:ligand-binding SRPBCC domain-containing protein
MIPGPFARFIHRHVFVEDGSATLVIDELEVGLPWWLGGEPALRLMVAGHLRAAFVQRQSELVRLVEAQVVS